MDMANFALASYLARQGVAVHLVAHRVAPELIAIPGVQFHRVAKPARSYLLGSPLLDHAGRMWARRLSPSGARVIVNGGNCLWGDVNWVHYVHAAYEPSVATGHLRRLKERAARSYFLAAERRALAVARLTLVNSHRTKHDVAHLYGVDADAIHNVYYGIDPTRFGTVTAAERAAARRRLAWPTDRCVVAFIGALGDRRKGFDVLFDAWRTLCSEPSWDVDLAVVGSGAEVPLWRARSEAAGLAHRVRFMGFSGEVETILAASDALVHPARYEAYGLGVHEALSRGLPALVSADAGIAERYPAFLRQLLIASPADEASVCQSLLRWHRSRRELAEQVRPLADQLRRHDWDAMSEQIRSLVDGTAVNTGV